MLAAADSHNLDGFEGRAAHLQAQGNWLDCTLAKHRILDWVEGGRYSEEDNNCRAGTRQVKDLAEVRRMVLTVHDRLAHPRKHVAAQLLDLI